MGRINPWLCLNWAKEAQFTFWCRIKYGPSICRFSSTLYGWNYLFKIEIAIVDHFVSFPMPQELPQSDSIARDISEILSKDQVGHDLDRFASQS